MIIDAHAHVGGLLLNGQENTVDALIAHMDEYHVDKAILFPILPLPLASPDVLKIAKNKSFRNDLVFSAVKRFPDRLYGIFCVNPRNEEEISMIDEKIREGSVVGLKLHPYLHSFKPQSSLSDIIAEKCIDNSVPLYIHSGPGASPIEIGELAARYPQVNIIIGHMGECVEHVFECVVVASKYNNIYLETSCLMPVCIKAGITIINSERILFGSECPTGSHYSVELPKYDLIGLNQQDRNLIFYRNAQKLFNI
ncbi:MAG: amidohydrolase family protein [Spirochaetota bacterium]|nr:amidohydrolase family protein [Spirochaetota bacterium]